MRDAALAHQKLLLAALEQGDAEVARSIATLQVEERKRWITQLLRASGQSGDTDELEIAGIGLSG
jgi:hypothetical protein